MSSYLWLLAGILVVGLVLIGGLALNIRSVERRQAREAVEPPDRVIPHFQAPRGPAYVGERESHIAPEGAAPTDLAARDQERLTASLASGTRLAGGYADGEMATSGGYAVLDDPAVAVLPEGAESMRELLPVVEAAGATGGRPLVIAASALHRDVVDTLRANRTRRLLQVVAVELGSEDLALVLARTGGRALLRADLQSGWVPPASLGTCARWVSDAQSSWILDAASLPVGGEPGDEEPREA